MKIIDRSDHSEVNQPVLDYIAKTKSGQQLIQRVLSLERVPYILQTKPQFKWVDLEQDDATFQCTSILLYIGALSFRVGSTAHIYITNPSAKTVMSRILISNTSLDYESQVTNFLFQGDIGPLLQYMECQGLYKSEKVETFTLQNEIAPQSIFVALLNTKRYTTKFEQHIYEIDRWVDAFSVQNDAYQVTEWKNKLLDFVVVPDAPTSKSKEDIIRKVHLLRNMNKENVYNLKVASFDKFHPNKTMSEIIDETYAVQALPYATHIRKNANTKIRVFVHVALSVGTSWILHKTWILD